VESGVGLGHLQYAIAALAGCSQRHLISSGCAPRSPEVLLSKMCMPCGWDKGQRAGSVLHYHCTLRDWQRFFIGPVPAKIKTKALRSRPTFNCILCRQHYRELQSKHQTHKIP